MSWDITVTPPESFPDINEPIAGVSKCPGNFYTAVMDLKDKQLREMTTDEAIAALKEVIIEVDKGNEGFFSDQYSVDADKQWSEGKELGDAWLMYGKFMPYKEFCGKEVRERIREAAVRFLLYYVVGYKIDYIW
jgi:hypothetical protein